MARTENVEPREIVKFEQVASGWWDPKGPMRSLHAINPLRLKFITDSLDVRGRKILDLGCGAGILTESLAGLGAHVTGIDLSEELLDIARAHAQSNGLDIEYRLVAAESLAQEKPQAFDAITCMEVLEHVPDPRKILSAIAKLLVPGGSAFLSTVDRTFLSFWFVIVGGEYILRLLPRGSHTHKKFIRPHELITWAGQNALEYKRNAGLKYHLLRNQFSLIEKADLNYMMEFVKQ